MDRIEYICSYISPCADFADVGCDHGYCSLYALKSGKCDKAYISDISAKSLAKAEALLKEYIDRGVCFPVCGDGLAGIPVDTEQVLIAGMGGMEIIKILKEGFIPRKFIFQPMKNADKLRAFLIERGCLITDDDIFFDGKYYFIIKGERTGGTATYSAAQLFFGRDSLNNPVLCGYIKEQLEKERAHLDLCVAANQRAEILARINLLNEALK